MNNRTNDIDDCVFRKSDGPPGHFCAALLLAFLALALGFAAPAAETNSKRQAHFGEQWHLENRGSDGNLAGPDLNVRAAWPVTHGAGIIVAAADVGFQLDHPELVKRASGGPHFNFYKTNSQGGPYSSTANHAT